MAIIKEDEKKESRMNTKRLRGFARVINSQMETLNSIDDFKEKYADEEITYLLEATDLYPAALLRISHGQVLVTAVTQEDCRNWKGTGAQALLRCSSRQFLDIATGKLNPAIAWLKRKLKIRGVKKMLELNSLLKALSRELKKMHSR